MGFDREGITIAGSMVADVVKTVDCYPVAGMLANISNVNRAVGGCVPNTAIDLAKIDKSISISAIGKVGDDDNGRYLISKLKENGVCCEQISISDKTPTSFCDVMSVIGGERTFFSSRGANAEFSPQDINIDKLNCKIFHIGYLLLLDMFDKPDSEYGTVMAHFLHDLQKCGIKTSFDVVSNSTSDFKKTILPALKYSDYIVINEVESSMLSDLEPYNSDGSLNTDNIKATMKFMAECGVKEKIIIHCKKAGFCYNVINGEFTVVPSVNKHWVFADFVQKIKRDSRMFFEYSH